MATTSLTLSPEYATYPKSTVSIPHPSCFSTLRSTNKPNSRTSNFKILRLTSSSSSYSNAESSPPISSNSPETETDPIKIAFSKAKAYKKSAQFQNPGSESSETAKKRDGSVSEVAFSDAKEDGLVSEATTSGNQEVPTNVKLAMGKAKEYQQKNKGDGGSGGIVEETNMIQGLEGDNRTDSRNVLFEKMVGKKEEELTVSSVDFMGLGFADKKGRGLPAGLVPVADPFLEGDLPEVEILVGDTNKFENDMVPKPKSAEEEKMDVYKPKVSTWGVFPRPSNISKTFGGGRVIRPGEVLETAEDKAAKETRTRELLAAYKSKMGLSIDPKLKSECEKALKDGDSLMDLGKLKEALPFYEKVMDKLTFQSELHGLAALQWSICQDSLSRSYDARVMYEKLQLHPNVKVSKKAKQFLFSFQAMELMKVKRTTRSPMNTGYQIFFEAFIEDKANSPLKDDEVEEGALTQALPYIIFLVSPIFIVLLIAVQKGI